MSYCLSGLKQHTQKNVGNVWHDTNDYRSLLSDFKLVINKKMLKNERIKCIKWHHFQHLEVDNKWIRPTEMN